MDDKTFLLQKVEFLEIQLKDSQTREQSLKSHFDSVINSVLAVTSPQLPQEFALKLEELKKSHSNELSILKFFYKQRVDLLLTKLEKTKKGLSQEISKLNKDIENLSGCVKDLTFENQQLQVHKQILEGRLEALEGREEEIEKLKERFCKKKETWKKKKCELKEEAFRTRENLEKSVEEIKSFYEKQGKPEDSSRNLRNLEELIEKLTFCLEDSREQNLCQRSAEFKYFMSEIDKKLLKIQFALYEKENSQFIAFKGKNSALLPVVSPSAFSLASPPPHKSSNNQNLVETCKKFQVAGPQKPPVHSPKHSRSFTQANLSPFSFQHSDRFSLQTTQDSSKLMPEKSAKMDEEALLAHLKIQLSRLRNQRDRGKNENERILLELKDSKFNLAAEKEKHCEKMLKVENEAKRILSVVKVMPAGFENYQREIAKSVYCITKVIN